MENLPKEIRFSNNIVFHIDYFWNFYTPSNRTDTIYEWKGYIASADIYGFHLSDTEIVTFMSILESFLKNHFPTGYFVRFENFTVKAFVSDGRPFIEIWKGETKNTLIKYFCNYILNCYNTVRREFNIKSATMFYKKVNKNQ